MFRKVSNFTDSYEVRRPQYPETTPVIQNIFYLCNGPSGLTHQMKVFSLTNEKCLTLSYL